MLELIVAIILCQVLRFVNVFFKMKVQSSINEFNNSIKTFGFFKKKSKIANQNLQTLKKNY